MLKRDDVLAYLNRDWAAARRHKDASMGRLGRGEGNRGGLPSQRHVARAGLGESTRREGKAGLRRVDRAAKKVGPCPSQPSLTTFAPFMRRWFLFGA